MNKKILEEINKHCKPNSILIITNDGTLKRLYVPFKVVCIRAVITYQIGDVLIVNAVKVSVDLIMVYVIDGKALFYYYFKIL